MNEPFSFEALGTTWWIEIWDEVDSETAGKIKDFSCRFCQDFNNRYSRFLPDSEISLLNSHREIVSSEETRELLATGIDLYRRSRGIFNMLTGHILEARGYDGAYSFIDEGSAALTPGNPVTDLVLEKDTIKLKFGNVDLGGYGKGYLIDLLAQELSDQFGLQQFLINGGGDIFVTHKDGEPVEIHLQDPVDAQRIVRSVLLKDCAFAASSPHVRSWPKKAINNSKGDNTSEIMYENHIVSDSKEIKDVIYLTAPTCTTADAFATTLLQVDTTTAQKLASENNLTLL